MIETLVLISLVLGLVIVAIVAYHLFGIFIALKRGGDYLENLASGLVAICDNTEPLNSKIDDINEGLAALLPPLLATNGNLAAIVEVANSK